MINELLKKALEQIVLKPFLVIIYKKSQDYLVLPH